MQKCKCEHNPYRFLQTLGDKELYIRDHRISLCFVGLSHRHPRKINPMFRKANGFSPLKVTIGDLSSQQCPITRQLRCRKSYHVRTSQPADKMQRYIQPHICILPFSQSLCYQPPVIPCFFIKKDICHKRKIAQRICGIIPLDKSSAMHLVFPINSQLSLSPETSHEIDHRITVRYGKIIRSICNNHLDLFLRIIRQLPVYFRQKIIKYAETALAPIISGFLEILLERYACNRITVRKVIDQDIHFFCICPFVCHQPEVKPFRYFRTVQDI